MKKLLMFIAMLHLILSQDKITVNEAINFGINNNISIKRSNLKISLINKEKWQWYLTYLPTVNLNHSFVKFSDENLSQMKAQIDGFKFLLQNASYKDAAFEALARDIANSIPNTAFKNIMRTNLTVNWELFANGDAIKILNSKVVEEQVEEIGHLDKIKELKLKIRDAYFDLATAEKLYHLNENRLKSADDRLAKVRREVTKGLKSSVDLKNIFKMHE